MVHRTLLALLIVPVLAVICTAQASQAQDMPAQVVALEQQLDQLAEKGFPGPVVAVLWVPPRVKDAKETPTSLQEVAESSGLKLFEQDDVYVLGPAWRRDFAYLFSDSAQADMPASECCARLLQDLDNAQWRLISSTQGLPFRMLNRDQQALVKGLFVPGKILVPPRPAGELCIPGVVPGEADVRTGSERPENADRHLSEVVPAETVALHSCRVHAWLEVSYVGFSLRHADGRHGRAGGYSTSTEVPLTDCWVLQQDHRFDPARYDWLDWPEESVSPPPLVPNTLKKSDLDYSLTALRTPISMSGWTSLADLVGAVAGQTGLGLHATPGSDKVRLFVSASDIPAGRLLKAVSLATTGTWRRFGDGYMFTYDKVGIGQIPARIAELKELLRKRWDALGEAWHSLISEKNILNALLFAPGSTFTLTPEQIAELWERQTQPYSEDRELPWSALTSEQQDFMSERLSSRMPSDTSLMSVSARVRIKLGFEFPRIGFVFVQGKETELEFLNLLPWGSHPEWYERFCRDAAPGIRVPLTTPLRACIWKPSKSDNPTNVVSTMERHGFNVLCFRVLADGYAAFPTEQFPPIAGLDEDCLQRIISQAHARGIKVFGVVAVLRWSDGRKRHWLLKRSDLLDYDILGRTQSQAVSVFGYPTGCRGAVEKFLYGEALSGDGVTPLSEEVQSRLQGLLKELASYDVDGLVLDHTSMMHNSLRYGMPGHDGRARQQFFLKYGADSIDLVPRYFKLPADYYRRGLGWTPLRPVESACSQLADEWRPFYRKGCDDLLDGLVKQWSEAKKDSPVWVTDSFGSPSQVMHDWPRFKGRISGVMCPGLGRAGHYTDRGLKVVPILRACDDAGTLMFATVLAEALGQGLGDEKVETGSPVIPATEGIVVDLTCAGRKKSAYLRLISPPGGR